MLMTVEDFRARVDGGLGPLVEELRHHTGRLGEEEALAWSASLPKLAIALSEPALSSLHLFFGGAGYLTLEYQLPAASSWCDVVLLGRRNAQQSAVVIELKDWQTWGDEPGPAEGLMIRHGNLVLHPSEQVRGYVEYCQRFHSIVQDHSARVHGCVLFTHDYTVSRYAERPNDQIALEHPCFTMSPDVVREALPLYLTDLVTDADAEFAKAFVSGRYRQDRGFVRQVGQQILDPESSPFALLDNQRRAFAMIGARLEEALFKGTELRKQVILVDGPPGSGKSVLAAKIWASLVTNERLPEGGVVFTTTSTSQTSNWAKLFEQASGTRAGHGLVKRASSYVPVPTHTMGRLRRQHGPDFLNDPNSWRENVRVLRNLGVPFQDGAHDEQYLVSIVDEAHALINPEHREGRGQFGFAPTLGPLAWHIIRSSKVSIFLLDADQGFRDRENTTVADVRAWANDLGAEVSEQISLAGSQFRCGGSKEYVEWVERVLGEDPPDVARSLAADWRKAFDFKIFDTPAAMEDALRERVNTGRSSRLVASFARPWKTASAARPHELPGKLQDFEIPYLDGGRRLHWHKVWNFIPRKGTDYTWFVQAPAGSPMRGDPLCEVGCPYAVRGFDFDYVGLLWFSDLKRVGGSWVADPDHVHETGLTQTLKAAKRENSPGSASVSLRRSLAQAYRILLTRGIYGAYVWFEDEATREYVIACLSGEA